MSLCTRLFDLLPIGIKWINQLFYFTKIAQVVEADISQRLWLRFFRRAIYVASLLNLESQNERKGWSGRKRGRQGVEGNGGGKENRTLVEALISSRLHRPRFYPLGASLPSNPNPRERSAWKRRCESKEKKKEQKEGISSHISRRGQHGFSIVSSDYRRISIRLFFRSQDIYWLISLKILRM